MAARLKIIILSVLFGALLAFNGRPVAGQNVAFDTKAKFAILVDGDTGSIFFEKNADTLMAPASMSKLMTTAMIFRELKAERLKLNEEVRISVNAWRTGGAPSRTSAMFAPVKSLVTVEQLIRGIVIQSGNDASIAIAERISGSEEKFAAAMEKYGKEIGLKNSTFRNATGLPDPEHLTTPRDLALLSRHIIMQYPEYYPYFAEPNFKYRRYNFYNRNSLVRLNTGYDGLKTGYTKESRYGIVVSAIRNGRRLIAVLNGLETKENRRTEAQRIIDWGFNDFEQRGINTEKQEFSARVWGGEKGWVTLGTAGPLKIYVLKNETAPEIESEVVYLGPVKAPVTQGQAVGYVRVKVSNSVQDHKLYARESIKQSNFAWRALDSVFYMVFGWLL